MASDSKICIVKLFILTPNTLVTKNSRVFQFSYTYKVNGIQCRVVTIPHMHLLEILKKQQKK